MTEATEHNLAVANALGLRCTRSGGLWEVKDSTGKHVGEIADRTIAGIGYWFCPWDDVAQALEAADQIFRSWALYKHVGEYEYEFNGDVLDERGNVQYCQGDDGPLQHAICRAVEAVGAAKPS